MHIITFINCLQTHNITFFTGVPDSQLKALCDYLNTEQPQNNITAANEGNALALAAGYHMATGKTACVYLQNSGLGNIINPLASLTNDKVYAIPALLVIGWRGEPGVHDEPQHIFQGGVTLPLLETMDIPYFIITKETTENELMDFLQEAALHFENGKQCAIVVKKGSLTYPEAVYQNSNSLKREEAIEVIVKYAGDDIIVSTTGKTSRELFEIRERNQQSHSYDFLTVGSMGHSSSIALGIALNKSEKTIWCVDGDGAVLMHMGSMAVIGSKKPENLIHVVINNGSHESVGGMPTVSETVNLTAVAKACNYQSVFSVSSIDNLESVLSSIKSSPKPVFIEVKSAIGSRSDLGRPTTTPVENKTALMVYLQETEI